MSRMSDVFTPGSLRPQINLDLEADRRLFPLVPTLRDLFCRGRRRRLRPASRLFILALAFPCAGCASWRSQTPAAPASAPGADPGGGFLQGLLQDVANASMNNWNFNKSSTDYGYPTTGDLSW